MEHFMRKLLIPLVSVFYFCLAYYSIHTFEESNKEEYEIEKEEGRSGALEALDFWTNSRAYPGKDIPKDKYTSIPKNETQSIGIIHG
jgi:hypothetical protein